LIMTEELNRETGRQPTHTSLGTDLAAIAAGAGIAEVRTIKQESQVAEAAELIPKNNGPSFILLKVKPTDPPKLKRQRDAAWTKFRFRQALLGK
jgi:phosphonopyruvate decarboxylase